MGKNETLEDIWERHYESLSTEEARVLFLLYLKKRRDLEGDGVAGDYLVKLNNKWLKGVYGTSF